MANHFVWLVRRVSNPVYVVYKIMDIIDYVNGIGIIAPLRGQSTLRCSLNRMNLIRDYKVDFTKVKE